MKRIKLSTILTVLALLSPLGSISPAKALPPGVPNQPCGTLANPKPGDLCYVLHQGMGVESGSRGGEVAGELTIQPQAGYYVVDSVVHEHPVRNNNGSVSKRVLAVGAKVETVEGYRSSLDEVNRVINELEGRIAGKMAVGDASVVAEARNKLTYLRETKEGYERSYRTAVSASSKAPTTQYTWRASSVRCGMLGESRCGSSIWLNIYEVRRYLGDPIAEYNAMLVPAIQQARDAVAKVEQSSVKPPPPPPPPPPDTLTRTQFRDLLINELVNMGYTAKQVTPLCNCVAKDVFERYTSEQLIQLAQNKAQYKAVIAAIAKDCNAFYPISRSNQSDPSVPPDPPPNTEKACLIKIGNMCILPIN